MPFWLATLRLVHTANLILMAIEFKPFLKCCHTVNMYVDVIDDKCYHVTRHAELHHTATSHIERFPLHQLILADHGE